MKVAAFLEAMDAIAPLRLAGSWDNVGLLLEGNREIKRVGLCIDLTEGVWSEFAERTPDAIVAYHPVVFRGLKRLTSADSQQRTLLAAARAGVHIYSPHSALDAASEGMNDWLLEPFGELTSRAPIVPDKLEPELGVGRLSTLAKPMMLSVAVEAIKSHLGMSAVRMSGLPSQMVSTVAVCPGAGGSVFESVGHADLFLTGEMRHHDVLARREQGCAVVLTDHTNTERGYLPRLAERLRGLGLDPVVSRIDSDPLRVV